MLVLFAVCDNALNKYSSLWSAGASFRGWEATSGMNHTPASSLYLMHGLNFNGIDIQVTNGAILAGRIVVLQAMWFVFDARLHRMQDQFSDNS